MLYPIIAIVVIASIGLLTLNRIVRRSGVTDADLSRALPGDTLVPDAIMIMDRAASFHAPVTAVWPWIVQLGKERGGWYFPRWIERFAGKTQFRGLRLFDETFQELAVGQDVPDWGPGDPVFRVIQLEPPRVLVYLTLRQPSANWTWPEVENPLPENTLVLSWALILEEIDSDHTRFYVRLRGKRQGKPFSWAFFLFGGLIDYLTIVLMFAGLRERLRKPG
jgi:hypothetical protein